MSKSKTLVKRLPYSSNNARILAFLSYFAAFMVVAIFADFLLTQSFYSFALVVIVIAIILFNLYDGMKKLSFGKNGVDIEK